MKTKDLLACTTPEAIQYIQSSVSLKSQNDYQKLKKLFDAQQFEAKSFDDSQLDILTFDWISLERDRNWWWQLQALPFLSWFTNSLELQTEEERPRYFSLCLDAIQCWDSNAKRNNESPLAWHDHASAFRARNLTNWLLLCHAFKLPVSEDARAEALADLIVEHLVWLGEERHYSKHTNHGFDQAMIALTIGLMFAQEEFGLHCQLNRRRLKDEVTFAFTDEGVHKENSPGYQKMMLGRLGQLRTLAALGEQNISTLGERYIEKAEVFLRAITLPNGYLPMIGDTRGGDEGLTYVQKELVDVLDYSASGYVVVRGADGRGKEFYILLKNSHESNYHRHDDDMMIYLYYDGKVVLGDGGLYCHQETDDKRKHLRSYLSHSVPYLSNKAIRDKNKSPEKPISYRRGALCFYMESSMFGERLSREVQISTNPSLMIEISDSSPRIYKLPVRTNFFIEHSVPIEFDVSGIRLIYGTFNITICSPKSASFSLHRGWSDTSFGGGAIVSREYGKVEDALGLSVANTPIILKAEID